MLNAGDNDWQMYKVNHWAEYGKENRKSKERDSMTEGGLLILIGGIILISVLAAVINITVNLLLIKHIGLYAASISTVVAYLAMFIYRTIDSKKYVNFKLNKKMLFVLSVAFSATFVSYYINDMVLNIVMLIAVLAFGVIYNKSSFAKIGSIIKRKFGKK